MRRRSAIPEYDGSLTVGERPFGGDRQFVSALHRGLEILRCFRPVDNGLGNLEIAQRTGLSNSTVSRLTYTLSRLGYLSYDPRTGRYRLGIAVLGLGYACLAGFRIRETAQHYMQEMAEKIGDGLLIALAARDSLHMTYVACARSGGVMSLQLNVGSKISLPRSSAGRAYLAAAPQAERERLLAEIRREAGEQVWPRLSCEIDTAIAQVRDRGYCLNMGQWQPEVNAAAVPFHSIDDDTPLYALNCGGPAYLLPRERLEREIAPMLLELSARLAQAQRRG